MAYLISCVDDLLSRFDHDLFADPFSTNEHPHDHKKTDSKESGPTTLSTATTPNHSVKHQNGKIAHPPHSNPNANDSKEDDVADPKLESKENDDNDDDKQDDNEWHDLSEEEALRMAMEMSMTEDDRKLAASIEREIRDCQGHLSRWFAGSFKSVRDKNMAWCDFCKRLHHQFVMYRIEQGIIQPLSYQFFIQLIAMLYGSAGAAMDNLSIDQHKIKDIEILSADNAAITYLRFNQGMADTDLKNAVYAKFASLAMDPMSPNEWKANHVMFIQSEKAPNGLLWTKWHMQ